MVSSSSRMSFRLAEIPKNFNMSLFLNANLMAKSDYVMGGGSYLASLNRLGTCLEHDPGYDPFWIFPFIANCHILMIIGMTLNIDLKINCIVDVDAIKARVQGKYLS